MPGGQPTQERPFLARWRTGVMRTRMSMTRKMVLIALEEFADKNGGSCFPSMDTIADLAGCCSKTVQRHLRKPCDWFRRLPRKGRGQGWRSFEYQLVIPEGADTRSARSGRGVRASDYSSAVSLDPTRGLAVTEAGKLRPSTADSLPLEQASYQAVEQRPGASGPTAKWLEQDHEFQSRAIEVRHHLSIGALSPDEGRARLSTLYMQAEARFQARKRGAH